MSDTEKHIREIDRRASRSREAQHWVYLSTPLTSTSWDGDAKTTAAKALLDLSAVFGVPADVRAVDVNVWVRDSGSAGVAAGTFVGVVLGPTNAAGAGRAAACGGMTNDVYSYESFVVPCDENGDIYVQLASTGASTLDVFIQIYGYLL